MNRLQIPRTFRILASILLVVLASCRSADNSVSTSKTPIKVIYLTIWADQLNNQFRAICEQWAAETGNKVEVEAVALKDLSAKLATIVAAQSGADLAMFPSHLTIVYHDKLADVSDVVDDGIRELGQPYSVAAAMNRVNNKWVGVPLFAWSHVWVYRADLLSQKKLRIPDTWDEAATLTDRLNDPKNQVWGLGIGLGKDDDFAMFFQSLLWAFGGSVIGEDGRTVTLDSPETRTAVRWMLARYNAGVIPPGALGWDGATNNQQFLAGKIALTANSPTIYFAAKHQQPEMVDKIAHSLYPKGPKGRFAYATAFSLAYLNSSTRSSEIKSLIRYLLKRQNYDKLIKAGEGSVNPQYENIDAMSLWGQDERLRPAFDTLKIEKPVGWPGPVTPAAAEIFERRIVNDMFARIINDHLTVDQAVAEAAKRAKEIVDRH